MRIILLIFLILFLSLPSFGKNQVIYFEPKFVKLVGVIRILQFPGEPDYESIENGDADETGPYLILNNAVDVKLFSKFQMGNNEPQKNVKFIQLIVNNDHDWSKIKTGNEVCIIGTLFSALTAHHHARLLLRINTINIIAKHEIISKKLDITREDRQFLNYQHLQGEKNLR